MNNQELTMKSWRIEFIKSKRAQPKHVYTYTKSLMGIIIVFNALIIALGVNRVMNETNVFGILLLVVGTTMPWPFLYVGFTAKSKLKRVIREGYYPKTDIDKDRYAISREYYGIEEEIDQGKMGGAAQFDSDFNTKQVFHERKRIFGSFRRKRR